MLFFTVSDMLYFFILLLQITSSRAIISNKTDDLLNLFLQHEEANTGYSTNNPCSFRLHSSLDKIRKRQTPATKSGFIDLSGYALHQTLRHAPFDMYVTDIKVRTPGTGNWARVEKCQFSNAENRLVAQLLFNDLAVTGNVRLFEESELLKNPGQPEPVEFCSMTVRLKRAGLGINAFPTRGRSKGIEVRTEARFVDPNYLSIHAYGCKLTDVANRGKNFDGHVSYLETQIQQSSRFKNLMNDVKKASEELQDVRIVTLLPDIPGKDDLQLHRQDESELNNYHKEKILSVKFQNERDRLKAVLHVKNLIAQQANQVFQAHGPFSQFQNGPQGPFHEDKFNERPQKPVVGFISTITELDENFTPLRPIQGAPFMNDKIVNVNNQGPQTSMEEVSREMEDMFLRGIKTLLTKYLEKQLEIPLKEALMFMVPISQLEKYCAKSKHAPYRRVGNVKYESGS